MSDEDPKQVVRRGYDAVSRIYRSDEEDASCRDRHAWLDELVPLVPRGSAVLDLGCGCGIPVAKRLARDHAVTGVDLSPVQIARARALVPGARLVCADMTALDLPEGAFAAVVCLYALVHVPLDEQRPLLANVHRWLVPGGHLLATVGHRAWTGTEEDWLGSGAPMWWSHADEATNLAWLDAAGFEVLWTRFVPEGDGGATLLLARRPPLSPSP